MMKVFSFKKLRVLFIKLKITGEKNGGHDFGAVLGDFFTRIDFSEHK